MLIAPMHLVPDAKAATSGTVYQGGNIYTMTDTMEQAKDPNHQAIKAQMVITENGKIVYVGDSASAPQNLLAGKKVVELGEKTMLPGLIDGHGHFPGYATTDLYNVNLYPTPIGDCDDLKTIQERITIKSQGLGNATKAEPIWINGSGYDDTLLKDIGRHPNADELQVAAPNQYVYISHISGHLGSINRKYADALLSITEADGITFDGKTIASIATPQGLFTITYTDGNILTIPGVITEQKNGDWVMTGVLNELDAMGIRNILPAKALTKEESAAKLAAEYQYGSRAYAKAGVTMANQSISFPGNLPSFREFIVENKQQIRMAMHPAVAIYGGTLARYQLGWNADVFNPGEIGTMNRSGDERTHAPNVGEDLTRWSAAAPGAFAMPTGTRLRLTNETDAELQDRYEKISAQELVALPTDMIILGQFKILTDGSNQGNTGWFKSPGYFTMGDEAHPLSANDPLIEQAPIGEAYKNELWGLPGSLNMEMLDLNTQVAGIHAQGQGTTIHANGTRANEAVVAAYERAVIAYPDVKDTRHTIIHAQTQERQLTQRLVGIYDDIVDQEQNNGTHSSGVQYIELEGLGNPENYGLFDEYLIGTNKAPGNAERIDHITTNGYGAFTQPENQNSAYDETQRAELRAKIGPLMKDQNFVSSYFVDHTYYWGDRHKNVFMGPGVAQQISPMGWAVEYDHYYNIHNDTPIVAISPLRSTESAVTRIPFGKDYALTGESKDLNATVELPATEGGATKTFWNYDQRVNVLQALRAATIYGAFSFKVEDRLGSLEVGKHADFVILDQDPFTVDPTAIADIRVATTIVADKPVYGVLPGATDFANQIAPAMTQDGSSLVAKMIVNPIAEEDLDNYNSQVSGNAKIFGTHAFTAEYSPAADGQVVTFQMDILGNGMKVSDLELHKITSNTDYEKYTYADIRFGDGTFWIVEDNKPLAPLAADAVLEMNKMYILFFSIADNGAFDFDTTVGKIEDPVRLVSTSGTLPTNGTATSSTVDHGSSGGCTVGTEPMYDMMLLFFAGLGLIVFRSVKRKED